MELRKRAVDVIAAHRGAEDMISIGAYVDGSDARIDEAKRLMPKIDGFLRQDMHRRVSIEMGLGELRQIFAPQPEPGTKR
jgi:flagellum-specific ATP synthase